MNKAFLDTASYKGVRDFYPNEMAIQTYIFETWAQSAETFGFERYDASILEPAALYKAKGAENEELVNEQTYTFIDRGEREVTLRPEMTPTVARLVAAKRRELKFPLRWYSIPNLFRYERPQKGRLREHWQLNCDIFGSNDNLAEIEILLLAHQLFINFGATERDFIIKVNDRQEMATKYAELGITEEDKHRAITNLNDRFHKITHGEYKEQLQAIVSNGEVVENIFKLVSGQLPEDTNHVVSTLKSMGISNVELDRSIARGFSYYTGTVFEIFEADEFGQMTGRAMLGGGRYDNLTSLFDSESVPGVGFGMGDVRVAEFLTEKNLLPRDIISKGPSISIIPTDAEFNLPAEKIAQQFRVRDVSAVVDFSNKKIGKKISDAVSANTKFAIVVGSNELATGQYLLKNLATETELSGTIEDLIAEVILKI